MFEILFTDSLVRHVNRDCLLGLLIKAIKGGKKYSDILFCDGNTQTKIDLVQKIRVKLQYFESIFKVILLVKISRKPPVKKYTFLSLMDC